MLEKQLSEAQASEASLSKAKAALETKLAELEELLLSSIATNEELTGMWLYPVRGFAMVLHTRFGVQSSLSEHLHDAAAALHAHAPDAPY